MRNDQDEKYEGQEDSEYHFSDDEVNYDVEAEEEPKPAATKRPAGDMIQRLTSSKRMLISLAVFLILIFIVYRMVAPPATTTPSTDIAPVTTTPPATEVTAAPPAQPAIAPPAASLAEAPKAPVAQAPLPQQVPAPTPPQVEIAVPTAGTFQSDIPVPDRTVTPAQLPSDVEAAAAALDSTTQKQMGDIQADYAAKLSAYENQNKALQTEVQNLNDRIGKMERQINQLVQTLTRSQPIAAPSTEPEAMPAAVAKARGMRIGYSVQAIIPGRAWLRSEDGDTVTVTEGDAIKNVGRVTKIDPYDGVVEINTGDHVISLSYGNDGG